MDLSPNEESSSYENFMGKQSQNLSDSRHREKDIFGMQLLNLFLSVDQGQFSTCYVRAVLNLLGHEV